GYQWDGADPRWMVLNESNTPVIIHAAELNDFESFPKFQDAILSLKTRMEHGHVRVPALKGGTINFPLSTDQAREAPLPSRQGAPIQSPFLIWHDSTSSIVIEKDGRRHV